MTALLLFFTFVLFDAEFVKTLLDLNEAAWQSLGDETVPPEQDLATLTDLTEKLAQWVPKSFLQEHVTEALPPNRGETIRLKGHVVFVKKYAVKAFAAKNQNAVYCCTMILSGGTTVEIFCSAIPQTWKQDLPIQECAAAWGVYVKSYVTTPVFAAPAIEWYPDTWLGNLGFNVASLDQIPVCRVTKKDQNDDETNRLAFKFTEADQEPFYGLLRAVSATAEGWLEKEAKKQYAETPYAVTDLFNRPGETRGKPILLRGTAKRIIQSSVTNSEVHAMFGIDHYYQIYLFTNQSQGNPIVVCVHSLPEGMPVGDAADFSVPMTVAAIPYKLWIYETSQGLHYAPILVGRSPVGLPVPARHPLPETFTTISFAAFFTLALIWYGCRLWVRQKQKPESRL